MKRKAHVIILLALVCMFALTARADCPTSAVCPQDGATGYPTGQYKWAGAVEFEKFAHPSSNGQHVWWVQCN